MLHKEIINKDNLEKYLIELSKQYKKISGRKMPAEIVIIGGASIVINYGFRNSTEDIDVMIASSSAMKEAIYKTAEKLDLPDDWLNTDFKFTTSFSNNIPLYSKYYKTFSNIVQVRTLNGEYLLAMKLKAARIYKYDLLDIIGILNEERKNGHNISKEEIYLAGEKLYGKSFQIDEKIERWLDEVLKADDLQKEYQKYRNEEKKISESITEFKKENPEIIVDHKSVKYIAEELRKKINNK